jgi:mannose-6-phosphate isomerase-like protein (cupin superfamily)
MLTLAVVALTIGLDATVAEQAPQTPAPAVFITREEHEAMLKDSVARNAVDQPIKATDVPGGKASVAMLYRVKPEASALIHNDVTETYYILSGSGTLVTGGSLGDAKPYDLTRVNAGMSQQGTRVGGDSRRVKAGDIIIVPAGTPHSFSALDGPISYLVYRFEPKLK